MSRAKFAGLLVTTIALLTTTSVAHANDPVAAEALFKEGRALLDKGRIDEACELFMRSEQLDQGVGTLINIGECFERTKHYASAWGAFREAANLALKNNDPRAALARDKAARVEPRVARLTLKIDPSLPSASVTRNGVKVDAAAFNTSIPVDPGPQSIEVTAPNRKAWQGTLDLHEGEAGTLRIPNLEVLASSETPAAAPVAPPKPPEDTPTATTQSKVALGLELGGGLVLATGLVFGALAISTWSSVEKTCPNGKCATTADRDRLDGDQGRASTFAAVSTVTALVGGAALVTGIVLHLTAPSRRIAVAPTVDRTGCGLLATLRL